MSVNDFDVRYLDIWRDGGTKEVRLPMPSRGDAVNLRHRMYRLRAAMKKEHHPYHTIAVRVTASIVMVLKDGTRVLYSSEQKTPTPEGAKFELVFQSSDRKFEESLANAGYIVSQPPPLE